MSKPDIVAAVAGGGKFGMMDVADLSAAGDAVQQRAAESGGTSADCIYSRVERVIRRRAMRHGVIFDIGCGVARFREHVSDLFRRYVGVDVVSYQDFPPAAEFVEVDLNSLTWPAVPGPADVVVCLETIEHLENPRAVFRNLVRIAAPGALVVVTTPNQLSWVSLLALIFKDQFSSFQERPGLYPAHVTALLEVDLRRSASEVGLTEIEVEYSNVGRMPGTSRRWPRFAKGKRFSDNVLISGYAPGGE